MRGRRVRRVVLLTNGPGELWGWVRPLAAELGGRGWRVSLRLLPCQFASGAEGRAAASLGLSASGPESAHATALALWRERRGEPPDAVVQLGGDLMWGRMLSRRRAPLFCYSYGAKRGLEACAAVYTAFPAMARAMTRQGVSPVVAGDLAADLIPTSVPTIEGRGPSKAPCVAFFPGSRPGIRDYAIPLIERTASTLRELVPSLEARVLLSPFDGEEDGERLRALGLAPSPGGLPGSLDGVDFAVTQPGTNTLELMHRAVPFLVAVPFSSLRHVPLPGLAGALSRLPLVGAALRAAALRSRWRSTGFTAWPNRLAGRQVVDEMIGDVTPGDIAARVAEHLGDPVRLAETRRSLSLISSEAPRGAAARMADHIERTLA